MKWGAFYWAHPLLGIKDGPRYYGISFFGFMCGWWERPRAYALRLERSKTPD